MIVSSEAVLNRFQRQPAGLGHVSGEDDDGEQGQGAEEEVGAEGGAG